MTPITNLTTATSYNLPSVHPKSTQLQSKLETDTEVRSIRNEYDTNTVRTHQPKTRTQVQWI